MPRVSYLVGPAAAPAIQLNLFCDALSPGAKHVIGAARGKPVLSEPRPPRHVMDAIDEPAAAAPAFQL